MSYLWTSEAVSCGHPDKVADQIADTVLDAHLVLDQLARVACEVTVMSDLVLLTGEISSDANVDVEGVTRGMICRIGYDRPEHCFDGNTVPILNKIKRQSSEIAKAVTRSDGEIGAGDQGMMFGFACNETETYMPLAHYWAFRFVRMLERHRREIHASPFLPDAKTQVTVRYDDDGKPEIVDTVLISTQHNDSCSFAAMESIVRRLCEMTTSGSPLFTEDTRYIINPGGSWHVGGPAADTGLSGRKIIVDNYGSDCPHGGGSFSGKDPTKVDRSAAYAARHIAKNIVASGRANRATVQLSYGIGMAQPISIRVQTDWPYQDAELTKIIKEKILLTPLAIIKRLYLLTPIYRETATGGHFGNDIRPWEQLNLMDLFKKGGES